MIALVTGGNRGIGLEVCRQLAAHGHEVILGSRDRAKGERVADGLRVVELDVADDASVRRAAGEIGVRRDGRGDRDRVHLRVTEDVVQGGRGPGGRVARGGRGEALLARVADPGEPGEVVEVPREVRSPRPQPGERDRGRR